MLQQRGHGTHGNATGTNEDVSVSPVVVCSKGFTQIFEGKNVEKRPLLHKALGGENAP